MGNKVHVKKDDMVMVNSGKSKGVKGKVLSVFPKENRVIVEGVNVVTKHMKPSQKVQQGGIIKQEGKIHASNVLLYCDSCKKGVRVGKKALEDGTKVRYCKKCGETFNK
ncbi:50S ribosomal protein L24 [Alkalibaculum sp. M08DMB]|uniref:Large ribosomal subunit protein uL24 n=1 Tax=Alkalibaculum sporogenes TaxID=2655001 RepID=A0A6A7K6G5_9FIRM|nr:50S ribosomal protein L24 [Alkalibaculum sporogenes]MPW25016.1 50S ribosomal protein L24 [Alkalibaculum sporogenes]